MSFTVCLFKFGRKKKAFYRIVVKERHKSNVSSYVENLGFYDPFLYKNFDKRLFVLSRNRLDFWLSKGAEVSVALEKLLLRVGFFREV